MLASKDVTQIKNVMIVLKGLRIEMKELQGSGAKAL